MQWHEHLLSRTLCIPTSTGLGSGHLCLQATAASHLTPSTHPIRSCTQQYHHPKAPQMQQNLFHFQVLAVSHFLRRSIPEFSCGQLISYSNSGFGLKVTSLGRSFLITSIFQSKLLTTSPHVFFRRHKPAKVF